MAGRLAVSPSPGADWRQHIVAYGASYGAAATTAAVRRISGGDGVKEAEGDEGIYSRKAYSRIRMF
jgi:hypothetical protein